MFEHRVKLFLHDDKLEQNVEWQNVGIAVWYVAECMWIHCSKSE